MSAFDDKLTLQGVKLRPRGGGGIWRWFRAGRPISDATYSVLSESDRDRRREARRRVYLRSGKILAESERFLVDCGIRNQSRFGLQLRLAERVALPREILVYDDSCDTLMRAEVIWRRGDMIGCKVTEHAVARGAQLSRKLRKPFYAVR